MRYLFVTLLAAASLCVVGCSDDGSNGDPAGDTGSSTSEEDASQDDVPESEFPEIRDLTVEPATITRDEAGAGVEFTVEITIGGFEGTITDADAFIQIQSDQRQSGRNDFEVDGNIVRLTGVDDMWFQGLEAGEYQIGANVASNAGEDVTQLDLAAVTVSE